MSDARSPAEHALIFAALVDALVPGDDVFPKASSVGVQDWLMDKLREMHGADSIDQVLAALSLNGESLAALPAEAQTRMVAAFEQNQPELFGFVLRTVYFGYYKAPLVVRAVRQSGHVYNDAPLPEGYDLGRFDPALHAPQQPRGFYVATEQVARVDLTGVDTEGLKPR